MKTLALILGAVLLWPMASKAEDCIMCPVWSLFRTSLPNPPTAAIRKVVAPLVTIESTNLRRRVGAKECRRNVNLADTIVFHHSDTPTNHTVQDINEAHLNRYSPGDPWLMIGYHYAISGAYGGGQGSSRVMAGRPLNISGAHAGSDSYRPMSAGTAALMRQNSSVTCGIDGGRFAAATDKFKGAEGKANYTTIGVVVIGNYAPVSAGNPGGYPRNAVRYPSNAVIENAGRLACEIQRRHSRVTNISWHSAFNQTECPGTVRQRIQAIKNVAARFGCRFN